MAGPYLLAPKATFVLNDILGWVAQAIGPNFSKTALRVTYENDQDQAPVVIGRTYTPSPGGGTYGQFCPGINVVRGTTVSPVWITGLRNNGVQVGYRTNYSLLNLLSEDVTRTVTFTLYDATGSARKTATLGLNAFAYLQDSIKNLFGTGYDTIGTFSLKIEFPPGAEIQAYASVVDNLTGAPVLIPAGPPPTSPTYLPAVAHTTGKNGTLWRSDIQLTNPDNLAHTWAITYIPKQADGLPVVVRSVTMAPQQSVVSDDVLLWAYGGALGDSSNTTGVLKIKPSDGTYVYPIVQARSFNQTTTGTFGQTSRRSRGTQGASAASGDPRLL